MKRAIAAIVAFNFYAVPIIQAFWAATPFIFHGTRLNELEDQGIPFKFSDWGFGEHYVWRLLAAAVSTAFAAFIAGAIARKNGSRIALIANVPSVVCWIVYAYMLFFLFERLGLPLDEGARSLSIAFGVACLLAIPMTCWIASIFGQIGEDRQAARAEENKTLGIADWHWSWLWVALSAYGYLILIKVVKICGVHLAMQREGKWLLELLLSPLAVLSLIAWIAPVVLSYMTLQGSIFRERSSVQRGALAVVTIVGGYIIAWGIELTVEIPFEKAGF